MKIAMVAPPWLSVPPRGYGGVELVVALLADGLVERGHDVTLFASGDSVTRARLDSALERAPGPEHINDPVYDTVHTLHAFRDPERFDLFHTHAPFSALAAAAAIDRPSVHTVHGAFTPKMKGVYEAIGDRVALVAISRSQRSQMPHLNYAGVIYNGLDVAAHPFRERKDEYVLFLGRTAPEKGPLAAALAAKAAGIPLVMAIKSADREEVAYWERQVAPALPTGTKVLREVSPRDKLDLLSRARAVLFPIDWEEPFGLVMAEAMACGTPVICTPRGAAPEVVADGETGFIVPVQGYPEAAAEALARIGAIDPAACRRRVRERFGKEQMVRGYEAVFERVVAAAGVAAR